MTDEKGKMQKLLGEGFSPEEIDEILREDPELAALADRITALFQKARSEPLPSLSSDFTARVMENIQRPSWWHRMGEAFFSWKGLATASACAASFLIGLWLAPQYFRDRNVAPLSIREGLGPNGETVFYVRFTAKSPGAKTVSVAGDFNQWNPLPLRTVNSQEGLFSAELPLRPGTYGYSFLIDDKTWIVDPAAGRFVDDGFGNKNSVINL